MSEDPERILTHVRPYLAAWGINADTPIELASHSENIVYRVRADTGRDYALRVHRPGYHSLAELESEQQWTGALRESGLAVPDALATGDGKHYLAVNCGADTRQVGLIRWLEGRPLNELIEERGFEFLHTLIADVGALCARFHDQATAWTKPKGFTRHQLNIDGFTGEAPFWGRFWESPALDDAARKDILQQRDRVARRLEAYGQSPNRYSMIHADMHDRNLLVQGDEVMVIDFDDAGFGWHMYDIAVILFSYLERPDFETLRDQLLRGYQEVRALDPVDLECLPLFLQVRTLALIGWISARPELGYGDFLNAMIHQARNASY